MYNIHALKAVNSRTLYRINSAKYFFIKNIILRIKFQVLTILFKSYSPYMNILHYLRVQVYMYMSKLC